MQRYMFDLILVKNYRTIMKKTSTIMLGFLPFIVLGQYGETIRTGRPGQAIGGFVLGKSVMQIQSGYQFNQIDSEASKMRSTIYSTVLRFGVSERIEFSGLVDWQTDKLDLDTLTTYVGGISNTQIGGRINLTENKGWVPTIGLQGRVLFKSQSEPYLRENIGGKFILATGNSLSDKLSLGTNWGITWTGNQPKPVAFYIINLSYNISQKVGTFVELYGNLNEFTTNFDAGFSYLVNKDFQLDASAGWQGRNDVSNWFIDFGVSWRVDWRKGE